MKRSLFSGVKWVTLLLVTLLFSSCTMVDIVLGARYASMPQSPMGIERVIDQVMLQGGTTQTSSSGEAPSAPSPHRMGNTYKVFEKQASQRHRDESVLDQLLAQAQRKYPGEAVNIRSATETYRHLGTTSERQTVQKRRQDGSTYTDYVTYYRAQFQIYYVAEVVVAEPMPAPPTLSVELPLVGVTRADLYRRAHNWLTDTKSNVARIEKADLDLGRIQGEYTIVISQGQTYAITSTFTIDVHDERADIKLTNPRLQRSGSRQTEPIFLQSIADRVKTEMGVFSEELKNTVTSR
jgi:hypothetical protein